MKQAQITYQGRRRIVVLETRCLILRVLKRTFKSGGKENSERPVSVRHGGVAQLGEHLLCKQGVIGSIPFISTKGS